MNKIRFISIIIILLSLVSIFAFPYFTSEPLTFIKWTQNEDKTMKKYKDDWDSVNINSVMKTTISYQVGEQVATITIPKMDIYELPVYYGSNPTTNNWQITTPGYLDNWSMFGESGVSCVGAHNYQHFANLSKLEKGDKILIETNIDRYVYTVENSAVYDHNVDNWNEIATTKTSDHALNLMTCYPFDEVNTDDMYIVYTSIQKGTLFYLK